MVYFSKAAAARCFMFRGVPGYHVALAKDNEKLIFIISFQLLTVLLAGNVAPLYITFLRSQ
jgi:hypothetical protein